ncbi:MAG: DEAD/DEAH box helicase, partial [Cenarchaeum sp. SB0669_bin_11]|nr:DEAD/DEAH box helicase [Cenarchaeum sp. SB0669_bin_11]
MKVRDLEIPDDIVAHLNSNGIETLYPPQRMAVKAGLMGGKSILVSAPTASGKSLIALLALLSMLKRGGRKAVYLSPLKALAAEKYNEFKGMPDPIRPSISIADLNVRDRLLGNILCMTNERMDLALRRDEGWVDSIDLVITDEIHLVGDVHRGPVLEMVLTRLRGKRQIVGLSATISNAKEIAQWLDCKLVKSSWRPVKLTEGVCEGHTIRWSNNKKSQIETSSRGLAIDLALDSVKSGHQSLIFVNTRRGAPSQATKAAGAVRKMLNNIDKK